MSLTFFVGLHQPSFAQHFMRAFISVNTIWDRKSDFVVNDWIMDSGAFSEVSRYGGYRHSRSVVEYAARINRWASCGNLLAAVSQDWMCEPHILRITGLSVAEHQVRTVARYDKLLALCRQTYILPVLQGYAPRDYLRCLELYGDRISHGAWVGVGSICKRNGSPAAIRSVLSTILAERPDLKLHGFGVKYTSLSSASVRGYLHTADSMAWSFAARMAGRNANDWREAETFVKRIEGLGDLSLFPWKTALRGAGR